MAIRHIRTTRTRSHHRATFGVLFAVVACLIGITPSASAAAQSPTATQTGEHAGWVSYSISTPQGTLTYGWRPLTQAEKAHQTDKWSGGTATVRPNSASGCEEDVCISVIGTSNHVDDWSTSAYWYGGYLCTHSYWYLNGAGIRTGNGACGGAGVFFSDWHANRYFPYPSQVCNDWQVVPGYACETIHK